MASRYMLCSFKTCPWVQRAAIVLQAKQVPYDITYIDRDKRPDWFLAVSPHSKVPVLQIDGKEALFESNAIAEYLEETAEPRLHPAGPDRARAQPRMDRLRADVRQRDLERDVFRFGRGVHRARGQDRRALRQAREALAKRGNDGPYFNGPKFSLVDAAYAPFLQRYTFMDRLQPLGMIEKFPQPRRVARRARRRAGGEGLDRVEHRGRVAGEPHRPQALALEVSSRRKFSAPRSSSRSFPRH